ncbi:MAG: hypothetical protein AAFQ94_12925 [Bacteroidota bacterium]
MSDKNRKIKKPSKKNCTINKMINAVLYTDRKNDINILSMYPGTFYLRTIKGSDELKNDVNFYLVIKAGNICPGTRQKIKYKFELNNDDSFKVEGKGYFNEPIFIYTATQAYQQKQFDFSLKIKMDGKKWFDDPKITISPGTIG